LSQIPFSCSYLESYPSINSNERTVALNEEGNGALRRKLNTKPRKGTGEIL
jgi:hypothetical protein